MGVLAVSGAAVLIRLSGAPALAVAFWRCALGALVLLPLVPLRREALPRGRTLGVLVLSGLALGAHFGLWIPSLDYTSVAASVVLVSTTPVFVAALAYLVLGERTSALSLLGILVAVVGSAVIAGDSSAGSAALFGDLLALGGALAIALNVLVGRSSRTGGVGFAMYCIVVYAVAAVSLLPVLLVTRTQLWGYDAETWFWLAAITAGPQILGHTVLNWALGYVEAAVVSASILAEPVGAAVLAWVVLSEEPGLPTVVGGAVVLLGLLLLLRGRAAGPGARSSHTPS